MEATVLALFLSLLMTPASAAECGGGKCALNPGTTEAFVSWSAPDDAKVPPIDKRESEHLHVATFALG